MFIERVDNGYIVTSERSNGNKRVFRTLEEVFEEMLLRFEGRTKTFGGSSYGKVTVERVKGGE